MDYLGCLIEDEGRRKENMQDELDKKTAENCGNRQRFHSKSIVLIFRTVNKISSRDTIPSKGIYI
jgi:hypothetical protein